MRHQAQVCKLSFFCNHPARSWAAGTKHRRVVGACTEQQLPLCAPRQGYGAKINYEIAAPLLADISRTLRKAAESTDLPLQQARLMFAHCETLVPLASLMDLFRPSEQEVAEHTLGAHREGGWRGSCAGCMCGAGC
jgi:hypothetical protein